MRHRKFGKKLNRTSAHRRAMFRNQLISLFTHEQIETTDAKAKVLKRLADKVITLGKRGTLHARRLAARDIHDREVLHKIFTDLAQRYESRPGGYTRIVKYRVRKGDGAPTSIVELVSEE